MPLVIDPAKMTASEREDVEYMAGLESPPQSAEDFINGKLSEMLVTYRESRFRANQERLVALGQTYLSLSPDRRREVEETLARLSGEQQSEAPAAADAPAES